MDERHDLRERETSRVVIEPFEAGKILFATVAGARHCRRQSRFSR
jgi:hypothetical protein